MWPVATPSISANSSFGADWARAISASDTVAVRSPMTSRSIGSKTVVYFGVERIRPFFLRHGCMDLPYPACCIVAHRPAVCSFFTSVSTLSFSPEDTTALPSVWTCIISSVARLRS